MCWSRDHTWGARLWGVFQMEGYLRGEETEKEEGILGCESQGIEPSIHNTSEKTLGTDHLVESPACQPLPLKVYSQYSSQVTPLSA